MFPKGEAVSQQEERRPDTTEAPPWADLAAYRADYLARNPVPPVAGVPADLARRKQWLAWRYEPGESVEKKPRKMPYYPGTDRKRTGGQGSDRDRSMLTDFATAAATCARGVRQRDGTMLDFDGVGFAFLPGDGLVGIDLDGMIDAETGEVSERCAKIIEACGSYTEYSPSGKGVHIICRRDDATFEGIRDTFKSNEAGVEVFSGRQYFTFTGRLWPGSVADLVLLENSTARRLLATVESARGLRRADAEPDPAVDVPPSPPPSVGGHQRSLGETMALAIDALGYVSPDSYETWIDIGMACKAGLGGYGFVVWDEWSQKSAKYVKGDTAKRWKGFEPKQITIGTLFAVAESSGWVPPWKKPKRKAKPTPAPAAESTSPLKKAGAAAVDEGAAPPAPPPDVTPPSPPDDDWQRWLITKKGETSACLANAELILANAPQWSGVIGYDEFAERTVFRKPLPFAKSGKSTGDWTDDLDIKATIWLQRAFYTEFARNNVGQAVESVARDNRFHPVRDALRALPPWDGVRRLAHWMIDFLGVKPETDLQREYIERVGTYFLRGMVQRVMRPGSKFDYCLVLEGEQGKGKSSVARVLSWHWFADTDLDLTNKDSLLALPGKWVYEIAELGSLMRAEERKQKSFLSRQEDEYRPPYASRMTKVPRQNVFIGTTNEEEYLKDATGGRRFWPVMVSESIDLDGLMAVRELLYAEALHDFDAGERSFPLRDEEQRLFVPEQVKRGLPEPFEELLQQWVSNQYAPFSMATAATDGLHLTADKLTPAVVTRVGIALKKLGCGRKENRLAADPGQRRLYLPPSMMDQGGTTSATEGAGYAEF